jgi:isoleucyl-tRNA synthetase
MKEKTSKKSVKQSAVDTHQEYITDQIKAHLTSFYRWGVLLDRKDINLTLGSALLHPEPSYIDSCLEAIQELVSKNKIRLDYKPLFWSVKQNRVVPPSEIEAFEEHQKGYFAFFTAKESSLQEDLKNPRNKIGLIYPEISFIAQVEQPWQLAGVKVAYW